MRIKTVSILLLLCTLLACKPSDKAHKKVFTFNFDVGLTTLDPAFARNLNAVWATNMIFNGLLQLGDDMKVNPCIAKNYTVSPDGKVYTFNLRDDVYFHDDSLFAKGKGRKVVAQDFVYSFNRIIDKKTASSGAWIFNDKIDTIQPFMALNDSVFVVKLRKPFPPLPSLLTVVYASVVPHEVVDFYGKDFRKHPVGTGAFLFKFWYDGEALALVKNEHYFETDNTGKRLPYLDAVKISFISDKQTAFMEFLKGNLCFFSGIDGNFRNDLLTKNGTLQSKYIGKFNMQTAPFFNTEYIGISVDDTLKVNKNSPLLQLKFRQAISYAINREKLVKYLQNSLALPGNYGFVPPYLPGMDTIVDRGYAYNPQKCRALLQELGYDKNNPIPTVKLTTTTTYRSLIEWVQGQLQNAGIPCKVDVTQSSSLREIIIKGNVNFFRGSWTADYPDAENYLSVFYSQNFPPTGPNYTHFTNPEFDQLFADCYKTTSDSARYSLYRKMDKLVMDNAPVLILYYDRSVRLYQNNIKNLQPNPLNVLQLKQVDM